MPIHKSNVRPKPRHASVDIASSLTLLRLRSRSRCSWYRSRRLGSVDLGRSTMHRRGTAPPDRTGKRPRPCVLSLRERVSKARAESISSPFIQLSQGFAARSFAEHEA